MTKTTPPDPFVHVGDPRPAGFFADESDLPELPYEQAMALRSLEAVERAEERKRQEELAERREERLNRAVVEAHHRAHVAGERWDPSDPWRHYPTPAQRIDMCFAAMDAKQAMVNREARQAAAAVLREHGVTGQIMVDASQPAPRPNPPSPGESSSPSDPAPAGTATRSTVAKIKAALRDWARVERDPHPLAHDGREIWSAAGRARRAAERRNDR